VRSRCVSDLLAGSRPALVHNILLLNNKQLFSKLLGLGTVATRHRPFFLLLEHDSFWLALRTFCELTRREWI